MIPGLFRVNETHVAIVCFLKSYNFNKLYYFAGSGVRTCCNEPFHAWRALLTSACLSCTELVMDRVPSASEFNQANIQVIVHNNRVILLGYTAAAGFSIMNSDLTSSGTFTMFPKSNIVVYSVYSIKLLGN